MEEGAEEEVGAPAEGADVEDDDADDGAVEEAEEVAAAGAGVEAGAGAEAGVGEVAVLDLRDF